MAKEDLFFDKIELQLSDIYLLEDEVASDIGTTEIAEQNPLLNKYRSLAKVQFVLCHSLPAVNANGAAWTYPTLVNSYQTVQNQLIDLNHKLKDNQKNLNIRVENEVIGHMIDATIAELEQDDNGLYPLIPEKPIAIVVTGYLYKRVVPKLVEKLKRQENLKVSMECEYTDVGFLYEGKLYTRQERPELLGQRTYEGKPVVRILGGIDPNGGYVNFWGAAILDNQSPADKDAEVLSAVAMEIGTGGPSELKLVEETEDMAKIRISEEMAQKIAPILGKDVAECLEIAESVLVDLFLEKQLIISDLEAKLEELSDPKTNVDGSNEEASNSGEQTKNEGTEESKIVSEEAAIIGSLEDQMRTLKDDIEKALRESGLFKKESSDNEDKKEIDQYFYIYATFPTSVIICVWDESDKYYQVPYAILEDRTITFGQKHRVDVKEVLIPVYNEEDASNASENDSTQGDSQMAKKETKEVANTEDVQPSATSTASEAQPEAVSEAAAEEIASLKDRIEQLVKENLELKGRVDTFEAKEEEARRQTVIASRKAVLAEDFEVEDLLDEEDIASLANMTDEKFEAYAAKMKKIAAKAKKKMPEADTDQADVDAQTLRDKTLDPGEQRKEEGPDPIGKGKTKKLDLSVENDVDVVGQSKDPQKKSTQMVDKAEEENTEAETASKPERQIQRPAMPEFPVNKELRNNFRRL